MATPKLWTLQGVAMAAALLSMSRRAHALRSCTRLGQATVPCEDELLLEHGDRFLLTLRGQSCYSIDVSSTKELEVFFYETNSWLHRDKRIPATRALQDNMGARSAEATEWAKVHVCHEMTECHAKQANLSASTMYDLVIARFSKSQPVQTDDTRVFVKVRSCEPVSSWFYAGLAVTGLGGFLTMFFLLSLIVEFAMGVPAYAQLRRTFRVRDNRFIELAQVDPDVAPEAFKSPTKSALTRSAVSATAEFSDADSSCDEDEELGGHRAAARASMSIP